ncbi:hypothetical protein NEIPOLOT_01689 [Neisseria polysaccharea ATCC 43768]|nr:hypothetical protein NEIPOLOT_01689 [Neisseria polysaccharea ATCC 43768]
MRAFIGKTATSPPSFPRKWESRFVEFQLFLINSCNFEFLDSRLRGNDDISVFDFLFLRE